MYAASASQTTPTQHHVGPHRVDDVGGHRLVIALDGRVTGPQAEALAALAGTLSGEQGLRIVADLRRMGKVGADARDAFQLGLKDQPVRAVALVGLNAAVRALASIAFGAVNLLKRDKVHAGFFKHPDEAHAWLDRIG
jgi:hypothetical protein